MSTKVQKQTFDVPALPPVPYKTAEEYEREQIEAFLAPMMNKANAKGSKAAWKLRTLEKVTEGVARIGDDEAVSLVRDMVKRESMRMMRAVADAEFTQHRIMTILNRVNRY